MISVFQLFTVELQPVCSCMLLRYVFLKIGREFRSYCLQVSPCQILEWDLPHLDNDTVGCVFNLEDQMKEVHEIFKDDLLNKLDSVLDRANLDAVPAYSTTTFSPRTDKVVPPSGRSFKGKTGITPNLKFRIGHAQWLWSPSPKYFGFYKPI